MNNVLRIIQNICFSLIIAFCGSNNCFNNGCVRQTLDTADSPLFEVALHIGIKQNIYYIYSPIEPEGKDRLGNELLLHHRVEDGGQTVDSDFRESHSEDAIKLCRHKRQAGFASRFGERLITRANVSDLNIYVDSI